MPRRTSNSGVKERRRAWSPYEEPVGFLRGAGWCRQTGERAGRFYLPPRETRVAQARSEEQEVENKPPYLCTLLPPVTGALRVRREFATWLLAGRPLAERWVGAAGKYRCAPP